MFLLNKKCTRSRMIYGNSLILIFYETVFKRNKIKSIKMYDTRVLNQLTTLNYEA